MPPAAIIGGAALLGAGASVVAAKANSKAIGKSTDAQTQANAASIAAQKEALDKQLAYQREALNTGTALQTSVYNNSGQMNADIYNQRQSILQPWAAGGGAAFNQINGMLGLPEQKFSAPKQLAFTPITAPAPMTGTPAPAATPTAAFNPTSFANIEALMTDPQYQALNTADRRDARREFQGVL